MTSDEDVATDKDAVLGNAVNIAQRGMSPKCRPGPWRRCSGEGTFRASPPAGGRALPGKTPYLD